MATSTAPPGGGECPRCGTPYAPHQEYCLECGLRLPHDASPRAAFGGRGPGRYAPDWVWPTLVALVVAVLTSVAAVAIAASGDGDAPLLIATTTQPETFTGVAPGPATTGVPPIPGTVTLPEEEPPPAPPRPPPARPRQTQRVIAWPARRDGFTVVLSSVPETARPQATAKAKRALAAGLDQVGVLESSRYPSLHPGYLVVFSGVYRSLEQAQEASGRARDRGYADAYAAQVTR